MNALNNLRKKRTSLTVREDELFAERVGSYPCLCIRFAVHVLNCCKVRTLLTFFAYFLYPKSFRFFEDKDFLFFNIKSIKTK